MTDTRVDALLDAWLEERARAQAAELRLAALGLAVLDVIEALGATSFAPTPALEEAIATLEKRLRDE